MTSSPTPLLSIVVPTRNRQECAISLARSLHRSSEQSFELVLHDNSDNDSLGAAVMQLADRRLRYIHTTDRLNMHENFGRAISQSRGLYVCGLGDDDGILVAPALRIIEAARMDGIDAILTAIYPYSWPGLRHWLWGDVGGRIGAAHRQLPSVRVLDPLKQVKSVFADATVTGLGMLPRVYHGIVSRKALDKLLVRTGSYFPGGSPDMANAVGLAFCINSMLYNPQPVVISGHSRKSGGGAGAAGSHHGRIEDQPHLPAGILDRWPASIPRYWSGFTIYAQSAIAAAEDAADQKLPPFAFHRLYASCLIYDRREYRNHIVVAMRSNPDWGAAMVTGVLLSMAGMLVVRIRAFVGNMWRHIVARSQGQRFSDIEDLILHLSLGPQRTAPAEDRS